jgi:hypothetical protein
LPPRLYAHFALQLLFFSHVNFLSIPYLSKI